MSGLQGTASEVLISKPISHPLGFRIMCRFMKFVNDLSMREHGTINRRLVNWIEPKSPAKSTPTRGVYTKDVVVDARTGVWVRLFVHVAASNLPEELEPRLPVVFYFHGGGFTSLSPDFALYDTFCRRLARRRRVIVISVAYRRSPEHRYPIPYDDCFGAVTSFCSGGSGRAHLPGNADLSSCFLMGDSAGGNIVHHVGCQLVSAEEETMRGMRIVGHVLLRPFFGGEERTPSELRLEGDPLVYLKSSDWHWKAFLPAGADRDHPACNVFGPNDAPCYNIPALPLPPTLVVVGGRDPLQDWQLRYVENMTKMNKDAQLLWYGEAMHVFHLFCQLEISSRFISDLSSFLTKCCGN